MSHHNENRFHFTGFRSYQLPCSRVSWTANGGQLRRIAGRRRSTQPVSMTLLSLGIYCWQVHISLEESEVKLRIASKLLSADRSRIQTMLAFAMQTCFMRVSQSIFACKLRGRMPTHSDK